MTNRLCSWPLGMWFFFACQQYWQITTHAFQFDFLKKKIFSFLPLIYFSCLILRGNPRSVFTYISNRRRDLVLKIYFSDKGDLNVLRQF